MRALDLLRVARAAAAAAGPFGCGACSPDLPQRAVTQLTSLLGLQLQQQAGYAAWRRGDESEDDDVAASAKGRHSKLKHSERRQLIQRKLQTQEVEDEELEVTQQRISGLLESLGRGGSEDSASLFVSGFFGPRQPGGEAAASSSSADDAAGSEEDEAAEEVTIEDLRYKGEGGRFAPPTELLSAADQAAAAAAGVADEPEAEMDAEMAAASMDVRRAPMERLGSAAMFLPPPPPPAQLLPTSARLLPLCCPPPSCLAPSRFPWPASHRALSANHHLPARQPPVIHSFIHSFAVPSSPHVPPPLPDRWTSPARWMRRRR